jgi:hypothetical protein
MAIQRDREFIGDRSGAAERIAEIGKILALGLVRLRTRQSTQLSSRGGEIALARLPNQSGHANSETENRR